VVVPGAHHALPMERPAAFDAVLAAWLDDVRPTDGPRPVGAGGRLREDDGL